MMIVDYMFFGLKLGVISSTLKYEEEFTFSVLEFILNTLVVIGIYLFFVFAYKKIKSYLAFILSLVIVMFTCMSTLNIINSANSVNDYKYGNYNKSDIGFTLSTTGHNVIVIMLDRALGQYIPYLVNERPELKEKFDGFTYYSNVISFGPTTNIATPALLGGYEYTPVELNKRDTETLIAKNN